MKARSFMTGFNDTPTTISWKTISLRISSIPRSSIPLTVCGTVPDLRVAKVRVSISSIKTLVSSIKNGCIRCFLLIQLKLETRVLILDTRVLILETRYSIEHNTRQTCDHEVVGANTIRGRLMKSSLRATRWKPNVAGMSVVLHRVSNYLPSRAIDGCIMRRDTTSSCQSAATSKTV